MIEVILFLTTIGECSTKVWMLEANSWMPGLGPAIHDLEAYRAKSWMAVTSPAMTAE